MKPSRRRAPLVALLAIVAACVAFVLFPSSPRGDAYAGDGDVVEKGDTKAAPKAKGEKAAHGKHHHAEKSAESADAQAPEAAGEGDGGAPAEAPSPPAPPADLKSIPLGKGLPVTVNAALYFLDVGAFEDMKGEFEATTDLRLRWSDPRLRYPESEAFRGYKELRGKDAEEELAKMWQPTLEITNRIEAGESVGRRLRVFPDGRVETITRTTAKYKVKVDPTRFPFDRQALLVDVIVREDTTDEVLLKTDASDVEFSTTRKDATLDGWKLGIVSLGLDIVKGWDGDRYSRLMVHLYVHRLPGTSIAPIFIPLVASLLIPLLALWMNRATEDAFEFDAFEFANIGIGGLFSVIALSFAIYSEYAIIAGTDNTVVRLFGLNYATLAIALGMVVVLFRFNVPYRLFGRYVHEQVFLFVLWAVPLLTLTTSLAIIAYAAV